MGTVTDVRITPSKPHDYGNVDFAAAGKQTISGKFKLDEGGVGFVNDLISEFLRMRDLRAEKRIRDFMDRTGLPVDQIMTLQLRNMEIYPQWKEAVDLLVDRYRFDFNPPDLLRGYRYPQVN